VIVLLIAYVVLTVQIVLWAIDGPFFNNKESK